MSLNPNPSLLDQQQILQRVFDGSQDKLRVDSSISIESIEGTVDVSIHAADGDNIAIANADGSKVVTLTTVGSHTGLDVNLINSNPIPVTITAANPGIVKSFYNEISSVASGNLTTVNTYTVPSGVTSYLQSCNVAGTTISVYTVLLNSSVIDKRYTVFGSSFNEAFTYSVGSSEGLPLNSGDVVQIKAIHNQSDLNSFNARIQVIEV